MTCNIILFLIIYFNSMVIFECFHLCDMSSTVSMNKKWKDQNREINYKILACKARKK